jgi:hypothetical protein
VFWQKNLCASSDRADDQNPGHDRRQYFFTYNNLTGRGSRCAGDRRQIERHQGVSASVHDSLSHSREVDSLAHALSDFLEPRPGIAAVNHAPQKAQALGCIVAISPNVVLSDFGVQGKKTVHAPWFSKYISRVAKLRGFDDNSFLNVENLFLAKQVDPARPA